MANGGRRSNRALIREWLWQNGVLLAVFLLGVWVILGLYRLNLKMSEIAPKLINARQELDQLTDELARGIPAAEAQLAELRKKTEEINASLVVADVQSKLTDAKSSADQMAKDLQAGIQQAQKVLGAVPIAQAKVDRAIALSVQAESTATAIASRMKKADDAVGKFAGTTQAAISSLEEDLSDLRSRLASLRAAVDSLTAATQRAQKDLSHSTSGSSTHK